MNKQIDTDFGFSSASIQYENSLDAEYKKKNGIFFTDMELANTLVSFLNIPKDSSLIDPSCGSGSFIRAFQNAGLEKIVGCDFDAQTVEKCQSITGVDEVYQVDTLGNAGPEILKRVKKDKFDYVVGNPPYAPINGKTEISTTAEFSDLVRCSGNNLFIAAIYRAFEIAKDDGYISFIIPKNLLHISSYKEIRKKLLKEKRIVSIVELGIHFKTVRGEQIVLTLQNKYVKENKIQFYKYNRGKISFMSAVNQEYYSDEIIVFTSNEEVNIYDKLKYSYGKLKDVCAETIHRGHNREADAIRGKHIRKFGFKEHKVPKEGSRIFIQNIFSAEAGITASYAGNLVPAETVTMVTLESKEMSKYILGLLHSRVCNYYLIRFEFNNSRLTIHADAKYLNEIPIVVDDKRFQEVISLVDEMESVPYMEEEWFNLHESLNSVVYKIYNLPKKEREYIEKEMKKISASKWYGDSCCTA
ncbi:putative RNA methylase [Lachnospiraceae bacterium PF1-21]